MDFYTVINKYKEKNNMTISELATYLGMSYDMTSGYLYKTRNPNYGTTCRLLDKMGYRVEITPKYSARKGLSLPTGEMNSGY